MTQPYYDFCVAAGGPSGRDATGGGQHWAGSVLYTCRLDADGSAIRIVSSIELPSTPPGYLTLARTRSGEQILYATSGEEIMWFSIGDENQLALRGSAPTGSDGASHLCTDSNARFLFMRTSAAVERGRNDCIDQVGEPKHIYRTRSDSQKPIVKIAFTS